MEAETQQKIEVLGKCVICFNEFDRAANQLNNIGVLKCGHVFHFECVDKVLRTGKKECIICDKKHMAKSATRLLLGWDIVVNADEAMNEEQVGQEEAEPEKRSVIVTRGRKRARKSVKGKAKRKRSVSSYTSTSSVMCIDDTAVNDETVDHGPQQADTMNKANLENGTEMGAIILEKDKVGQVAEFSEKQSDKLVDKIEHKKAAVIEEDQAGQEKKSSDVVKAESDNRADETVHKRADNAVIQPIRKEWNPFEQENSLVMLDKEAIEGEIEKANDPEEDNFVDEPVQMVVDSVVRKESKKGPVRRLFEEQNDSKHASEALLADVKAEVQDNQLAGAVEIKQEVMEEDDYETAYSTSSGEDDDDISIFAVIRRNVSSFWNSF